MKKSNIPQRKMKVPFAQIRANVSTGSYDAEKRTVDVVFATETEVTRMDWWTGKRYIEILDCAPESVKLERANAGAPVIDSHMASGLKNQLGVVERAWIENGQCMATLRFSDREEIAGTVRDIENGIVRNVSVGYNVNKYLVTEEDGKLPVYRATDWEPMEISMLPVPADYNSQTRGVEPQNVNEVEVIFKSQKMANENTRGEGAATQEENTVTEPVTTPAPENTVTPAGTETEVTPVDEAGIRSAAIQTERTRVAEIRSACRAANMDESFFDTLVNSGVTIDNARTQIINKMAETQTPVNTRGQQNIQIGADQADKVRRGMEEALLHRAGASTDELTPEGREFRGMDLVDMARFSLEQAGVRTRGMSRAEVAKAALGVTRSGGLLATTDFPNILGNTINSSLRKAYALAPRTFQAFTRKTTAKDFKAKTSLQMSSAVGFDEVKEGGEYKYATLEESKETYKVSKYGKIIGITWEAIVNDSLDAFGRLPQNIASSVAQKQSDIVYGILLNNPKMGDGKELFHTAHGNLASAGTAIDVTNLDKGFQAVGLQKSIDGSFMSLVPKFIITGVANSLAVKSIINSTIVPGKVADVNPFVNSLTQVQDPRITGNQWFLAASPTVVDTIEYAFLEGEGELFTEQRNGFDIDGVQIKARMVFGAKAMDFRGLYKNPGA